VSHNDPLTIPMAWFATLSSEAAPLCGEVAAAEAASLCGANLRQPPGEGRFWRPPARL
jgi:hypothetical protein